MAYYDFLDLIFAPLFKLPVLLAVIILSFLVSIIIILITKYTTDQSLMKRLRDDMKEYQKQAKEAKGNPSRAMELQKKSMELNMQYMSHSLKPTIITFIPIILIFGWMSSNFAYQSINPDQEFSITVFFEKNTNGNAEIIVPEGTTIIGDKIKNIESDKAEWTLKGKEGEHILEFSYNNEKQQKNVLITNGKKYVDAVKKVRNSSIKVIQINYKKLIVLPIGYKDWFGWLGTYIWSSILFTVLMRKFLKVY